MSVNGLILKFLVFFVKGLIILNHESHFYLKLMDKVFLNWPYHKISLLPINKILNHVILLQNNPKNKGVY